MLELKNFTFTHKFASVPSLYNISFKIQSGEFVALTGASGSGKSTLLQAIAGFIPTLIKGETQGELEIDGLLPQQIKAEERLRRVGYISSQPHYQLSGICATVREEIAWSLGNLGVSPSEMQIQTEKMLQEFNLQDLAQRHPSSLSSGQQQRLIIASILVLNPQILLLDEPAAFLDSVEHQRLLDYVLKLASSKKHTIIWASSSLEEASYFPRWLQIEKGRLVSDGQPCLLSTSGSLKAPWTRVLQNLGIEKHYPLENWPVSEAGSIDFLSKIWPLAAGQELEPANTALNHSEQDTEPIAEAFSLSWQNISFSYAEQTETLKDITLTLQAPDCVAFCGANGAGKTTLAKMSNGLLRPQQGALLINGKDTTNIPSWQLASQVGFIFHEAREQVFAPDVWSETAFGPQNLGLNETEIEQRCQEALELTHLFHLKNVHPYELSNTQLRRLSWAGVLAMHTKAIVMDEPNAALDEESWQIFTNMLNYLHQQRKTLVILITHNIDLISQYCQKIVLLDQGRLIDYDNTENILHRHQELPQSSAVKFAKALHF